MIKQARTGDTVLVNSRGRTGRKRRLGKDDRKQNTLALLPGWKVDRCDSDES